MYDCSKCCFNSEFDFSVAAHEKFSHAKNSRKTPFDCAVSYIEKHLCPQLDYKTHLKVYLNNHLRKRHKFCNKFHANLAKIKEKQCNNCRFKTHSRFLRLLHDYLRERDGNSSLVEQIWLTEQTEYVFMDDEKPVTIDAFDVVFVDNVKWFCCNNCSYKSLEEVNITDHIIQEHMRYMYDNSRWHQCDQCSYKTLQKRDLENHKLLKHTSNELQLQWFRCDQCDYKSLYKLSFKNHKIQKHMRDDQIEWFYCDQCAHKSKTKSLLRRHVCAKHVPEDSPKCAYKNQLLKNNPSEQNIKWFYCEQCDYKSNSSFRRKNHIIEKHMPDDQVEWFHCDQCLFKAKTHKSLLSHIRSHNKKLFHCDQCSFTTRYKGIMLKHNLKHDILSS